MPIYSCEKCPFKTYRLGDYNRHLNRKKPCDADKPHKKIKPLVEVIRCDICDKVYARPDVLESHNRKFHPKIVDNNCQEINNIHEINGDNNNNNEIKGDHNKIQNINTQNINTQNNINIANLTINVNPVEIHHYLYNDIKDLTLFEQYLSITSKDSPYITLLDYLNLNSDRPQYHNLYLGDIHQSTMHVHNGKQWIKEIMSKTINGLVDIQRIMLTMIFNRFRCFLNKKATKFIARTYYYGIPDNCCFNKKITLPIKVHLHNNRDTMTPVDNNIPPDDDKEIWWALSKHFKWNDVEKIIFEMDQINMDFDKNVRDIKTEILNHIGKDKQLSDLFSTFLKHIDDIINDFDMSNKENVKKKKKKNDNESDSSEESSDEFSNNSSDRSSEESSDIPPTKSSQKISNQSSDKPLIDSSEKSSDESSDISPSKSSKKIFNKSPSKLSSEVSKYSSDDEPPMKLCNKSFRNSICFIPSDEE